MPINIWVFIISSPNALLELQTLKTPSFLCFSFYFVGLRFRQISLFLVKHVVPSIFFLNDSSNNDFEPVSRNVTLSRRFHFSSVFFIHNVHCDCRCFNNFLNRCRCRRFSRTSESSDGELVKSRFSGRSVGEFLEFGFRSRRHRNAADRRFGGSV